MDEENKKKEMSDEGTGSAEAAEPQPDGNKPSTPTPPPPPPQPPRQPVPPPQPYYYQQPYYPYPYYYVQPPSMRQQKPKSDKPTVAGALLIIVGILGLIFGTLFMSGVWFFESFEDFPFNASDMTDISGKVVDANGTGLGGVTITITDTHLETITNATGYYQIIGVPVGYRELTLEKSGYNTLIYRMYITTPDTDIKKQDIQGWGEQVIIVDDGEMDFEMTAGSSTHTYGSVDPPHEAIFETLGEFCSVFAAVAIVCSLLAILGGVFAIQRRMFSVALIGAIAGIFSIGFGIGTILAIIALFVLLLAHGEFGKKEQDEGQDARGPGGC